MNRVLRISDPYLVGLALLATFVGLVLIFDAGYPRSLGSDRGMLPTEFKSQLLFLVPALVGAWTCATLKPDLWMKLSKILWFVTLAALLWTFRFGVEMNGARRWISVGPISVQPAEFAKLSAVLYLAAVFANRKKWPAKISKRKDWAQWMDTIAVPKLLRAVPALLVLAAIILIEKEPDLGTAAIIGVTGCAMFIPAGVSWKSMAFAVLLALGGCWFMVKQEPYRLERITNHVNRWSPKNVDDTSFQTVQSELAMATGGVSGVGIGNGRAKHVIPATTTDFIMATLAEEFGLLGVLGVLAIIGALVWRLMYQASRAPTKYASMVLFGLGAWIGIQACVNTMMANGFLPAIGIPFPFISSGGSSLLALWLAVGVAQSLVACAEPAASKAPSVDVVPIPAVPKPIGPTLGAQA